MLIDAHKIEKHDIGAAHTVALTDSDKLAPIVTGIWDVGVDPGVFPGRMWVNKKEIPDNGKDDDGNGYIDDVYGIGWTRFAKKDVGPTAQAQSDARANRYRQAVFEGLIDMRANLNTKEGRELKKKLSQLHAT